MRLLFMLAMFVSAMLLFLVQPMIGKLLMPLAGGTAAVWSTCMVFFQGALLTGYVYAHAAGGRGPRRFASQHAALLCVPLAILAYFWLARGTPLSPMTSLAPRGEDYPFFNLVLLLGALIGLPFFFLSTSAPLLQRWFADTNDPAAGDPYFLYAASNLGSMLGLLLYPLVLERYLPMRMQAIVWAIGFAAWVALIAQCARMLKASPIKLSLLRPPPPPRVDILSKEFGAARLQPAVDSPPIPLWEKLRWVALGAVPSSLMLSVTTYATTDLAPIPSFIVIPLALYLLTFVIAFAQPAEWQRRLFWIVNCTLFCGLVVYAFNNLYPTAPAPDATDAGGLLFGIRKPVALFYGVVLALFAVAALTPYWTTRTFVVVAAPLVLLVYVFLRKTQLDHDYPLWLKIAIVMLVYFMAALNCHMDLAKRRPAASRLTEYFIWMSVGGVVGGLFNGLLAPVIFNQYAEFACGIVAACLLVPPGEAKTATRARQWLLDLAIPIIIGVFAFFVIRVFDNYDQYKWVDGFYDWLVERKLGAYFNYTKFVLAYGVPIMLAYIGIERPLRFGLSVAAIFLAVEFNVSHDGEVFRTRSFFGALEVNEYPVRAKPGETLYHKLVHGTTLHGQQAFDPPDDEPLTYYHRTGPVGDLFEFTPPGLSNRPVAFIGLGTGSLTAYGKKGQSVTIYEIDPAIRRIATNPRYFRYLTSARERGVDIDIVMGDARLRIADADEGKYALIAVDAFSSDSIPIHLLTREALRLYTSKLAPDGIVAFHVSNRYLSLGRVVARLVEDQGLVAYDWHDDNESQDPGKSRSDWILVARKKEHFGKLLEPGGAASPKWTPLEPEPQDPLWTDDFSNVLSVFLW